MSIDFDVSADGDADACYSGVVTFTWNRRMPSAADTVIAQLLTDRAIAVIEQERQRAAAEQYRRTIESLKAGLVSNRRIGTAMGILMATQKITEPAAFELLRTASQRAHRKMRDIADEVVQTGWLEEVQAGTRRAKPAPDPQRQVPPAPRSNRSITEGCRGPRTR